MSPEDSLVMLAQNGSFELATTLAEAYDLDMTPIFYALTKKCLELSQKSVLSEYVM
jgi:hypothetical protein